MPSPTDRRVRVELPAAGASGYDVVVGEGALRALPELLASTAPAHAYAVVADDRVAALHGATLVEALRAAGLAVSLFSFPAGEANKTRARWAEVTDAMLEAGLGRDAAVLALGGGVTGDLAGFVAATYMRGLPLVQLPTTLLAMIDSSVGGKTGVDTAAGKNLVGAFLQPAIVVADTRVLATLPAAELRAGLAEAIKHGAIADAAYLDRTESALSGLLRGEPGAVAELVLRSVEIKAEVVGRDEREAGPRKTLNFGHTIGHAVEALSGYRLLHGEAVAIGMVAEARLGEALGVSEAGTAARLRDVLARAGLPTEPPAEIAPSRIVEATRTDKKARRGRAEYSLLERVGAASAGPDGRWSWPVDEGRVLEVLG